MKARNAAQNEEGLPHPSILVRKISGFTKPLKSNEAAFERAVDSVTTTARELLDSLVTTADARNREVEAARARARALARFGTS